MHPDLTDLLCDPIDRSPLDLDDAVMDGNGAVDSGRLVSRNGRSYRIIDGVPRFVPSTAKASSVTSFGDEWNHFNYDLFKTNWITHVVKNTFGTPDIFAGKIVVDCGAGSGMQTKWIAELGAKRVIALELSHSVDNVMRRNLASISNVDVVQCSIDHPPLREGSIDGIVMCHNVIQHTASVEDTARGLWSTVGPGGEFVFNCYMSYPEDPLWMARWKLVYRPLRAFLSQRSFRFILSYARCMAILRLVPILGSILEASQVALRGDVPRGPNRLYRMYKSAELNTFDWYGSHAYQHQKTTQEIRDLVAELQPNEDLVRNLDRYLTRPIPPGLAIRIAKE